MIIYNVTISIIDPSIELDWLQWMKQVHIPDVMRTKKFSEYRLCKVLVNDEITYAIQYSCKDQNTLNAYLKNDAPKLMEDHSKKFKGKFGAFRTFLDLIEQG
jgi:hypothetical protein